MYRLSPLTSDRLPTVNVVSAHERPPGVVLLDVRERAEWVAGHAPGAHHMPLGELELDALPEADEVYVVCRSGNRSAVATQALLAAGVDARNVDGGMSAWVRAGLPVEHS